MPASKLPCSRRKRTVLISRFTLLNFLRRTRIFGVVACVLLLVQFSFSQGGLSGQVTEVIDGRTVAIDVSGTRLTLVLQLIEVPESGQQLSKEVTEHLRGLLIGKTVEFKVRSMVNDKAIGAVFLKGVDVGQQMLRDGGAWLVPPEQADADAPERESYRSAETQARADKLGVWSIAGLKPPWDYLAENGNRQPGPSDKYRYNSVSEPAPGRPRNSKASSGTEADLSRWADIMNADASSQSDRLIRRHFDDSGVSMIATNATPIELSTGKQKQKLIVRAIYGSRALPQSKEELFVMAFEISVKASRLSQEMAGSIAADGKTFTFAPARHFVDQRTVVSKEMLFYPITREALTAIASARKSVVTIGSFTGPLDVVSQSLMLQLLDASN